MAKEKKIQGKERIKVLLAEQVDTINWAEPELYDFFDTPQEVRTQIVPAFLDYAIETYRHELWSKYKKRISQNGFAIKTVGIDPQTLSMYKTGSRFPSQPNADVLAAFFGDIIYDLTGYNRRMPRDRYLHELADMWGNPNQLDDRDKAELMERAKNLSLNKEVKKEQFLATAS